MVDHKSYNTLLSTMVGSEFSALRAGMTMVKLDSNQRLIIAHEPIEHVYFIESGIVSVVAQTRDNRQIDIGMLGREGLSGISVLFGAGRSMHEEHVQVPGKALRMPSAPFLSAVTNFPEFRALLMRYLHIFFTQVAQGALCIGANDLGPRLARCLLMCHDRLQAPALPFTHHCLSVMLSVRRSGVTEALHNLEGHKLIRGTRGSITILDRVGLIALAGPAYGVPEQEYRRLI